MLLIFSNVNMVVKNSESMARKFYSIFCELVEHPEVFEEKSPSVVDKLHQISKEIYDSVAKKDSFHNVKNRSLKELLIDGFDSERIWQQVLLRNKSVLEHFHDITQSHQNNLSASVEKPPDKTPVYADHSNSSDDDIMDSREYAFDDDDDDDDSLPDHSEIMSQQQTEEIDSEIEERPPPKKVSFKTSHFKTPIEDKFFKLSALEQYLHIEDLKEELKYSGEDNKFEKEKDVDSDEDIDLFEDIPSDISEHSDDDAETKKSSKDMMYKDFFDAPDDSGDENMQNTNEDLNHSTELHDEDMDESSDHDGDENFGDNVDNLNEEEIYNENENEIYNEEENKKISEKGSNNNMEQNTKDSQVPTAFEIEQRQVRRKITEYENSMLRPTPWQLTGEVAAINRPKNSLIHEQTDFDVKSRPVVIEDHDFFLKLENMAKMVIKNKAFDDGIRKQKTKAEEISFKKDVIIGQTKSKKGLAEVYEDDFLKQQNMKLNLESEEDPKHTEIKKLMDSLFPELHALFCHIPKPAIPDIKIVSNLPAVTVEEVAPTSVSDVTLLAPEEVKKKSGLVKGHTERTDTDRKHERRKKKKFQKMKYKKLENADPDKPKSAKQAKQEKLDTLKKLKQFRNTKIANVSSSKVKSSKDFFSRLQDVSDTKTKETKKTKTQKNKK